MIAARCALAFIVIALPLAAFAQDDNSAASALVTGPLEWNPSVQLKDFGYDSNILNAPVNPLWDLSGTLSPSTDAAVNLPRIKASGVGLLNFDYYERYSEQRSIGGKVTGRSEFPIRWLVPSLSGSYESLREREAFEIDSRVRHRSASGSVGIGVYLGTQALVNAAFRQETYTYAPGTLVRGVDVSTQLNRRQQGETLTVRYNVTPFTSVVADGEMTRDRYLLEPVKDQQTRRADVGVEFSPDAVIRGRMVVGWHDLRPNDPLVVPYKGYTANVELSYLFLGVTRVGGRYLHDTSTSIEAPYYVQTAYGGDIEQAFFGPVDLVARINRQLADYNAIPERKVLARQDRIDTYAAGVSIRLSNATRMTINYELTRRTSVIESISYDRARLNTSVTMGF